MTLELSREAVLDALKTVRDPELGRGLIELGMVKGVHIDGRDVEVAVELTTPACPLRTQIERDVITAVKQRVPEARTVRVQFTAQVRSGATVEQGGIPGVRNVVAIGSGKGGVGKSTVAALVALGLQRYGARVGLLDADVYGPSIPVLLGTRQTPAVTADQRIQPIEAHGLKLMSMGFLIPRHEAVVWRGPMLHGAMQQFLRNVEWGELDYLIVDLPPTTGDVPLSLAQLLPVTGAVVVCTPQDVALADAIRAITAFRKLRVPLLGVVENMGYFVCPHCGERTEIFGHKGARLLAEQEGIPFLGELPLNIQLRILGDLGRLVEIFENEHPVKPYAMAVCEQLAAQISIAAMKKQATPRLQILT
jgi:ATP-binding protein involved in chromosome partitioning